MSADQSERTGVYGRGRGLKETGAKTDSSTGQFEETDMFFKHL